MIVQFVNRISRCDYFLSFQRSAPTEMEYGDSSMFFSFTFTQQDIDNVLYGYIRTTDRAANGFALSGVYSGIQASGK